MLCPGDERHRPETKIHWSGNIATVYMHSCGIIYTHVHYFTPQGSPLTPVPDLHPIRGCCFYTPPCIFYAPVLTVCRDPSIRQWYEQRSSEQW